MDERWVEKWLQEAVSQLPCDTDAMTYNVGGVPVTIIGGHRAVVVIPTAKIGAGRKEPQGQDDGGKAA